MIARISLRPLKGLAVAVLAASALTACSSGKWGFPYKAGVQQGNWITKEQVALLQQGMSREQVRFALGSPTLTSVLHADRWDYPYYFKPGYGKAQERQFTVWFENDHLVRWSGDEQPDLQPFQIEKVSAKQEEKADAQVDTAEKRQEGIDKAEEVRPHVDVTTPDNPTLDYPGEPGQTFEPLK
ncbi:outer membrane protein assembly factor BamE [Bordetella bronchiseptica]